MIFDRYEIHTQTSVYFINAVAIIFRPASPQNHLRNMCSCFTKQQTKRKNEKHGTWDIHFRFFAKMVETQIDKNNMFQDDPIIFLVLFETCW